MRFILRPCYKKPEMLYFSLKYEALARDNTPFGNDLVTVFTVDGGFAKETMQLVNDFPYPKEVITHGRNVGPVTNIWDGFQSVIGRMDDYIFYVEDDVLMHQDYFLFVQDNADILRTAHTFGLGLQSSLRQEEQNLGIYEKDPPDISGPSTCITKEFLSHLLSMDKPTIPWMDGYMLQVIQREHWKTFSSHINRSLSIGVYGFCYQPQSDFPMDASYQDKIRWFEEHLQKGDWWKYSKTMKEILGNPDTLPTAICQFNPLLNTWKQKGRV